MTMKLSDWQHKEVVMDKEREMFEKSFQRPKNYFELSMEEQWDIDKSIGILDMDYEMTDEDIERAKKHYGPLPFEI